MIEATVIPNVPSVGAELDDLNVLESLGKPRVLVSTNNIRIGPQETLYIDGTLYINGTLAGSGLPTPETPAEALNSLNDVTLESVENGQVLKYQDGAWKNLPDSTGLLEVGLEGLTNVEIDEEISDGHVLKWNGTQWANAEDQTGSLELQNLNDVDITNLANGSTIIYDSASGTWSMRELSIKGLTDTNISTPEDASTLQYDAPSGKWQAVTDTEFVDAIIDAGFADAELYYVDEFEIDGGAA